MHRCTTGLQLWQTGIYQYIFLLGGIFTEYQTMAASLAMKTWFVNQGVPEDAIIIEETSRDTYENVRELIKMVDQMKLTNAHLTVCTHMTHGKRFKKLFSGHSIPYSIHCVQYSIDKKTILMEIFGLILCYIDPKGTGRIAQYIRKGRTFTTAT